MTFGEYFQNIIERQDISIVKIAKQIGIKSKTEIYRLFENKHSYEKAKRLTDKIVGVIDISDDEKTRLYELMQMCDVKIGMRRAWSVLEKLYKDSHTVPDEITERLGVTMKRAKNAETQIFIGTNVDTNVISWFDKYLKANRHSNINIMHMVNFNRKEESIAKQFFTIMTLVKHDQYNGYESAKNELDGMIGLMKEKNGYSMFVINDNGFVDSPVSEELYNMVRTQCSVSKRVSNVKMLKDKFSDYEQMAHIFTIDGGDVVVTYEGTLCFGDVPFDVKYSLLKDCNFFGFPEDSEYMANLIEAYRKRHATEDKSDTEYRYIFAPELVSEFVNNGKTKDHPDVMREMTDDEIGKTVSALINNPKKHYRFFDRGYHKNPVDCIALFNRFIACWNAELGYGKGHYYVLLDHPKLFEVFKSFSQYFWNSCTLSDKQSREVMKRCLKDINANLYETDGDVR